MYLFFDEVLFRLAFRLSWDIIFFNFFYDLHLFDCVSLQNAQLFVGFLFSERSNLVLIWKFHSVRKVSFATFHF